MANGLLWCCGRRIVRGACRIRQVRHLGRRIEDPSPAHGHVRGDGLSRCMDCGRASGACPWLSCTRRTGSRRRPGAGSRRWSIPSTSQPPSMEMTRHVGVLAPRKLSRGPQPDSPFSSTSGEPPHGCGADVPWWPVPLVDHAGLINHIALRAGVEPATRRPAHIVDGQLRKGNHDRLEVRSLESVPSRSSTAEPTEARRPPGKRRMASNHERHEQGNLRPPTIRVHHTH